jgi:DHA1 family inner membrane transport protein
VLAVLLLGLLGTAIIAPLQALILHHAGNAPTFAVAVNVGALNLGAAGSVGGGLILAAGAVRWTGLVGAALSLIGLALTHLILPRGRRRSPLAEPEDRLVSGAV